MKREGEGKERNDACRERRYIVGGSDGRGRGRRKFPVSSRVFERADKEECVRRRLELAPSTEEDCGQPIHSQTEEGGKEQCRGWVPFPGVTGR